MSCAGRYLDFDGFFASVEQTVRPELQPDRLASCLADAERIQAITGQTLRAARDLPTSRQALERRIGSLEQAHDLLTVRSWTGANLTNVVMRALDAFSSNQVQMSGEEIDVFPKHALALSLALHELATNAIKYGALSCPGGHVNLHWGVQDGELYLDWESGGPPVLPPTKKGFGSRLLEEVLVSDLGGNTKLSYDVSSVRCSLNARI